MRKRIHFNYTTVPYTACLLSIWHKELTITNDLKAVTCRNCLRILKVKYNIK